MNEQQLRELLATMTIDQVIDIAVRLHDDAVRLRAELAKKDGIVR
jgi:hypothetical protein